MISRLKAEKILRELNFDFSTFSLSEFLRFVGETKGREIITTPWSMPDPLFGLWITDGDEAREYIFYRDDVPDIHQIHIQLHELSHFLFGHQTLDINHAMLSDVAAGKTLLPFDGLIQLRSFKRSNVEVEAETLADLIQQRVIQNARTNQLLHDISPEIKLAHFLETMSQS